MKVTHIALAIAVSAAPLANSTPATAQQRGYADEMRELREFCENLIASGEFPRLNFGECISFNITPDQGFVAHLCDFLRETDALGDMTYAECVRSFRA